MVNQGHWSHREDHLDRLLGGASLLGWEVAWLPDSLLELGDWFASVALAACRLVLRPRALSVRLEVPPLPLSPYRLLSLPHPLGDCRSDPRAAAKGLLGPWDIQVREFAQAQGADDTLLFWPDGTLAETAIAAVAALKGDRLILPPHRGRVRSISEDRDLPSWAAVRGLRLEYSSLQLGDLAGCQLWCMNTVRGVWQAEVVQT